MKTPPQLLLQTTLIALSLWGATVPAAARLSDPADVGTAVSRDPSWFAVRQALRGWWHGFRDDEIDRLVPAVLQPQPAADGPVPAVPPHAGQLVLVLIGAREYAAHALLANERLAVLQAQRRLAAAAAPTREAARTLTVFDDEARLVRAGLRQHLQARDAYLAAWSVLASPPGAAQCVSQRSGPDVTAVPVFEARAPEQVPVALLMGRRDVGAAMAGAGRWLRMADAGDAAGPASQRLQGWVRASPTGLAPAGMPGEGDVLGGALERAGREVSQRLFALQQAQDELDHAQVLLQQRELELQAWRSRAAAQADAPAAEAGLLERYAQVLEQTDLVLSAKGRLALAWVQFHDALGAE